MMLIAILFLSLTTVAFTVVAATHARLRAGRAFAVASEALFELEAGVKRFQADTGEYPGSLVDLSQAITPSGKNACGKGYGANAVNKWKGPYHGKYTVSPTGVRLGGLGRVEAQLTRDPPSNAGGKDGVLKLSITNIREHEIARLDSIFDEIDARENGTWKSNGFIQWGSVDPQTKFVNSAVYQIAVSGC